MTGEIAVSNQTHHTCIRMSAAEYQQLLRNPRAKALDHETAGKIGFLLEKVVENTSHICVHHDLDWKGKW